MAFILDLAACTPLYRANEPGADPAQAAQTRILAEEALGIVRRYGPAAVLTATADALTYYAAQVQAGEPASSREAYEALADAIAAMRKAQDALRTEASRFLNL